MLILHCPYCQRDVDETDLHAGGEAHLKRVGPEADAAAFEQYLFMRRNTKGVHFERWRHVYGCGKWFLAARNTATLQVYGTYSAQTTEPPAHITEAIRAAQESQA
ncbi:sarcosine oxidase subunit delta [Salipiger sp. IMCC34102]|uniref:sarcosine oxidase subunit delta n=1 Tax=Salipiger sp. IMCC34102 TaxID=2510647 RepID=UPI00101DF694|nr:sarcosine oxidase subunit delta [Salipiger sp. IMCC34102]RYH03334.1 sarcosine oxidase subunit delta [Salipiger sp. IMCC34102]